MAESRDTGIKLFGKTIPLREKGEPPLGLGKGDTGDKQKKLKEASPRSKGKKEGTATPAEGEDGDKNEQNISTFQKEGTATPVEGEEGDKNEPNISTSQNKSSKSEEQRSEVTVDNSASNISQDNLLKKPDKILPCPRCSSMETKFCYYNNYSVNQPRHFCKNCQRYWTAGGTMRKLPVGAGRRKNKCSSYSSIGNHQFSHITISDELQHSLKPNRSVLSFSSDSVFITVEKTMDEYNRNRFHQSENGEEQPSGSLIAALKTKSEANAGNSNCTERFAVQIPNNSSGTTPWTFPWSPPIPFYPNMSYWGVPCLSPQLLSSSLSCPGKNSPTLGKHSRDGNILKHGNSDKGDSPKQVNCLLMPKTLRIDDPEAAEKNSICSSMGFKNDKRYNVTTKRGLFMDFQSKRELKHHPTVASLQILYANPAAHLRSVNLHEST